MKKKIFCLLVCMLLILTMVSCNKEEKEDPDVSDSESTQELEEKEDPNALDPKSAQELYDKIDEQMSALDSFKMDMSANMTFFISGYEVNGEITGYSFENVKSNDDYYFYTETTTKMTAPELNMDQTLKSAEAYYSGNYFIFNEQEGITQKLYSPMTAEEANKHRSESELDTLDLIKDCATKNFEKRDDGTWELKCSGYTKTAIEKISENMALDNDLLFTEVMDMNLVLEADTDYLATQIKMDFVFEETQNIPVVSITADYSQHNQAIDMPDSLNTENYTKVDNILMLNDIQKMLEDRCESESGMFTLDIQESVENAEGSLLSSYIEDNDITFGEGNNGYFYEIDTVINNKNKYNVSYTNGKQTVATGSQSQDNVQTEQEAREWITSLINSVKYDAMMVTDIKNKGDGEYKLTCIVTDTSAYETFFINNNGKLTSVNKTITVTIKDDRIVKIWCYIQADGEAPSHGTLTVYTIQTVDFKDIAQ